MSRLANGASVSMSIGGQPLDDVLKGLPDFAENKEQVETTVLKSKVKTYIGGLKDYGQLEYTCNYDKDIAAALRALEGDQPVDITLSDGTTIGYTASGVSVNINAASSGALMEMTVVTIVKSKVNVNHDEKVSVPDFVSVMDEVSTNKADFNQELAKIEKGWCLKK